MDLVEFWHHHPINREYVDEPEFRHLYARKGERYVVFDDGTVEMIRCVQIANVEAKKPKHGAFGRLLERIKENIDAPVFVENVQNKEVAEGLVKKYGFQYVNEGQCGGIVWCLYLDMRE